MSAMKKAIDLRSDTVTLPSEPMREAMYKAEVGDDVYGEDPSVNELEHIVAEMLGKESALFVTSGTQANLVSVLSHCQRGDEMILGSVAHIFMSEQGGAAILGGIQPRTLPNQADGTIALAAIEAAIRPDNVHYPITRLLCLENTHNSCGGQPLPVTYMDEAGELAHRHGLALHVDGARLWNAAVAENVAPAELVRNADSVSVCLSKGLGAPVGSLVVGSSDFIHKARRNRKVLGGGMRQAGVVAAAGIVAVTENVERLADDHANAHRLAQGFSELDGIILDPDTVKTNIVFFELRRADMTPSQFADGMKRHNVLLSPAGGRLLRAVTNLDVTQADIDTAIAAAQAVLSGDGEKLGETHGAYA